MTAGGWFAIIAFGEGFREIMEKSIVGESENVRDRYIYIYIFSN